MDNILLINIIIIYIFYYLHILIIYIFYYLYI